MADNSTPSSQLLLGAKITEEFLGELARQFTLWQRRGLFSIRKYRKKATGYSEVTSLQRQAKNISQRFASQAMPDQDWNFVRGHSRTLPRWLRLVEGRNFAFILKQQFMMAWPRNRFVKRVGTLWSNAVYQQIKMLLSSQLMWLLDRKRLDNNSLPALVECCLTDSLSIFGRQASCLWIGCIRS